MDSFDPALSSASLARGIAGPLETVANLLYLIANAGLDTMTQKKYLRMAQDELAEVTAQVQSVIEGGSQPQSQR